MVHVGAATGAVLTAIVVQFWINWGQYHGWWGPWETAYAAGVHAVEWVTGSTIDPLSPIDVRVYWTILHWPGLLLAIGVYSLLTRGLPRRDRCRCRSCRHLLEGLSEPRCAHCGSTI
jgi:hypothetical protein